MARPAAAKRVNRSSLRMARSSERMTMKANSATSTRQSATPNSSPATANTKSVWLSGNMRLTVPSPGPLPNQPPRMKLSVAMSMLKVSPDAGLRKCWMRRGDVRHGVIGHGQPAGGDAGDAEHPDQPHAGHEEQRAPHQHDQHGLAEVGLDAPAAPPRRAAKRARSRWPACRRAGRIRRTARRPE